MASCVGCKFLYGQGTGYSNYTWMDTEVTCAKGRNNALPKEEPVGWDSQPQGEDAWPPTMNGRCDLYAPGKYITLDVDGDDGPADHTDDAEQIEAICASADRLPRGDA